MTTFNDLFSSMKFVNDTERDNYMTAEEALKYGLIDEILYKRK